MNEEQWRELLSRLNPPQNPPVYQSQEPFRQDLFDSGMQQIQNNTANISGEIAQQGQLANQMAQQQNSAMQGQKAKMGMMGMQQAAQQKKEQDEMMMKLMMMFAGA